MRIEQRQVAPQALAALLERGVHPVLARLFAARGVGTAEELDVALGGLHPPAGLAQAQEMAQVLAEAIVRNQRLLLVGDYDADGATACAVGVLGLRALGATVDYLVPNRFDNGYGLTPAIARLAHDRSPDYLITVDNGIAAIEGIREANQLGMQVLVTDHHLPGEELPAARCIVNPNQVGCTFPSKHLAGVGVIFYVLLCLRARLRDCGAFRDRPEPQLASLLDLVALGTVADVVPLDRNNRVLVAQGLARIQAGRCRPGLLALFRAARRDPARASAADLGFSIGPRLNAAGRLEDMSLGVECLLAADPAAAQAMALRLDSLNRERRAIEAQMREEAFAALEALDARSDWGLCLYDGRWHPGVVGLIASRLRERINRPVIVLADSGKAGEVKGSGRSIPGLHLRDALDLVARRNPDLSFAFGGHAAAAGVTLRHADLERFSRAFEETVRELLANQAPDDALQTDGPLRDAELNLDLALQLRHQVWGQGFPPPRFHGRLHVLEQRPMGEGHLRLKLAQQRGSVLQAKLFGDGGPLPALIDAVYELTVDEYTGTARPELILQHWQVPQTP